MEIFKIEKNYTAPINLVWQAITDRAMMKEWYFDFAEDFKLEPGAVFEWKAGDTENNQWLHRGKMLEIRTVWSSPPRSRPRYSTPSDRRESSSH